jgi:glycosyltransferase involved in cell wall biosynthesis
MKILMISLDGAIADIDSDSARRMQMYGNLCDELHIIIPKKASGKNGARKIGENIFAYPAARSVFFFKALTTGWRILSGKKDWVITAQDPFETGLVGLILAKRFGAGLEIQIHGDFYGNGYWRRESFLNCVKFVLGKFVLRRANVVRVVSWRIAESLIFLNDKKIFEIPIYFDAAAMAKGGIDLKAQFGGEPMLLAIGNLAPVKNHLGLIAAFAKIKKILPKAKLAIAGEGILKNCLQSAAETLGLEDDVIFLGAQKELAEMYRTADIFVHNSFYEGWGRVLVEAAHFGLPIVTTDVGLAGELIKNNESGVIVPVGDEASLVEAVVRIANNREFAAQLGLSAKAAADAGLKKDEYLRKIKEGWEAAGGRGDCNR